IENAYQEIEKNVNEVELLVPGITQVIQNAVKDFSTMSPVDKQEHKITADGYKTKEIIFLPVNNSSTGGYQGGTGSHWSLLVYRESNKFYYYDSAGSMNLSIATKLAENFLQYLKISGSADINQPTPCPQQRNGSDCGVFTIAFTRCLVNKFKNNPGAINQADF
ncbi:5853_t:CDS:1, partial [Cetraspora pellucida]